MVYSATTMQVVYHRWSLLQTLENDWPIPDDDHRNRILRAAAIELAVVCRYHWLAQTDEEIAAWLCGRSEGEMEPERIAVAVNFVRARRRSFIDQGNTLIAKRRLRWASRIQMPACKGKWLFSFSQDCEKSKCAYDCVHNCNDRKCRGHAVWLPDPFDWQEPDKMLFARRAAYVQKSSEKLCDSEQAA